VISGKAQTSPKASDPRLRGLTCAIPFEDVWQAALRLTGGGLKGWSLLSSDDSNGIIEAEALRIGSRLSQKLVRDAGVYDIFIHVRLDENAQTRVDAQATARKPSTDFGTAARLLRRFFRSLDRILTRPLRRRYTRRT
jgi:hypothetical protein